MNGVQANPGASGGEEGRLAHRIVAVAGALGPGRRTGERPHAGGGSPEPDPRVGKVPSWSKETLTLGINEGGRP